MILKKRADFRNKIMRKKTSFCSRGYVRLTVMDARGAADSVVV